MLGSCCGWWLVSSFELDGCRHAKRGLASLTVVEILGFGWRNAAGVAVEDAPVVEPIDPFQGGQFEVFEGLARGRSDTRVRSLELDDRLGQGVVETVTAGSQRGDDVVGGEAFGVRIDRYCPPLAVCQLTMRRL